jgi:hypothetical protein
MPWVPAEDYDYDYDYEAEVKELTTGQRVIQEAQAVSQEDEEDVRQLAQVSVNGVYCYEVEWLPKTNEVRVEVDQYRNDDSRMYYWYPDSKTTISTLACLIGVGEEQIRITGLTFFTGNESLAAFNYETRQFMRSEWKDYAEESVAMQFNVEIIENNLPPVKMCENQCYDAACDGTNCEFKPRPHGIDGTQCDCTECDPFFLEPPPNYPEERAPLPESEPDSPKPTLRVEEPKPGEPLRIIEESPIEDKTFDVLVAVLIALLAVFVTSIFASV